MRSAGLGDNKEDSPRLPQRSSSRRSAAVAPRGVGGPAKGTERQDAAGGDVTARPQKLRLPLWTPRQGQRLKLAR